MATNPVPDPEDWTEEELAYTFPEPLQRARRDIKQATATMTTDEVRYLVSLYYTAQEYRITAQARIRRTVETEEPHAMLAWTFGSFETVEAEIKKALDVYTQHEATGAGLWLRSITGIGPVIAAGLLAHKFPGHDETVGRLWAFAGLDPTKVWAAGQKRPWNADLKVICVRPDQRVLTRRGEIPIAEVALGDVVLTHRGNWKPVTKIYVNDHDGELVRPRAVGRANAGPWLTGNHPVYTRQKTIYRWTEADGRERWRPAEHRRTANHERAARVRTLVAAGARQRDVAIAEGISEATASNYVRLGRLSEAPYETGWIGASGLRTGWEVFAPIVKAEPRPVELRLSRPSAVERDGRLFATGRYPGHAHPRAHGLPVSVTVDPRIARLIGLYLAEGHITDRHVGWSFHEDETAYLDEVRTTLVECFGLPSSITHNRPNRCKQVICSSKILAETLAPFGKGAYDKAPPPSWLWELDDITLAALLDGIFDGDGHLKANGLRDLGTMSERLARFVEQAGRRLGRSVSRCLNERGVYRVVELERPDDRDKHGSWHAVSTLERAPYIGPVYNLEVEDDHSYVVEGIAVHNCFHAGESFVKMQGRKTDYYGRLYAERKLYEARRNEGGELADQAEAVLKAKRIGKETVAYQSYSIGKLPAAHIHARARRWTVKLMLSHYHCVAYFLTNGRLPPRPYVITHLGHVDELSPPNMGLVPGMTEAWEGRLKTG